MRGSRDLLESRDAQNQDKSSSFGQMVGERLGRKLLSGSSGSNHCGFHHSHDNPHNVVQVWVQNLENQESDWCRDREGDLLGRNPFWGLAAVAINRSMALPAHRKVKINPQLFLEKKRGKKTCRHHGSRFTHTVNSTSTCALYYTPRRSSSQRLLLLSGCNRSISPIPVKKFLNIRCREQGTHHWAQIFWGVEGASSFCTALTVSITLVFWGLSYFSSLFTPAQHSPCTRGPGAVGAAGLCTAKGKGRLFLVRAGERPCWQQCHRGNNPDIYSVAFYQGQQFFKLLIRFILRLASACLPDIGNHNFYYYLL